MVAFLLKRFMILTILLLIDIISFVKQELDDSTRKVLTINIVKKVYRDIIADNGLKQEH